ncbi:hypothetical protein D3C87_1990130 [compost metagenome]
MINHQQPYGKSAEGKNGPDQGADQRQQPAQDMADHERAESDQRLQCMEQHETAPLLQSEKDDAADKGEEIA